MRNHDDAASAGQAGGGETRYSLDTAECSTPARQAATRAPNATDVEAARLAEIHSGLAVRPGEVHELRVLRADARRTKMVISGYYNDMDSLATEISRYRHGDIYLTCNPVIPALLARRANRADYAEETTKDHEIVRRRVLPLDIDPVRPRGIASTAVEHEAAIGLARRIAAELAPEGWPEPRLIDSGNGAYLLYPIDLSPDDGGLVSLALRGLAARYDAEGVHVDPTAANASRILRVPGTVNRKGDDTPDRPHRACRLLSAPEAPAGPGEPAIVTPEMLREAASWAPTPAPAGRTGSRTWSVDEWITRNLAGRVIRGPEPWSGGRRWVLDSPLCDHEQDGSAWLAELGSGALAAGCQHHHCSWRWPDLRAHCGPEREQAREGPPEGARDRDREDGRKHSALERAILFLADRTDFAAGRDGEGYSRDDAAGLLPLAAKLRADGPGLMTPPEERDAVKRLAKYRNQLRQGGFQASQLRCSSPPPNVSPRTLAEIMASNPPAPRVLWGPAEAPVIVAGELALLHSREGRGKTWIAYGLAVAVARGDAAFLGLPCAKSKVLVVSPELGEFHERQRFERVLQSRSATPNLLVLGRAFAAVNLAEAEHLDKLHDMIAETDARLVVLDPLAALALTEETNIELASLTRHLARVAAETGVAILINHHENKIASSGAKDDMSAFRGGTALAAGVRVVLRLAEEPKTKGLRLAVTKSNLGEKPSEIYLEPGPPWLFRIGEAPASASEAREGRMAALRDWVATQTAPFTAEEAQAAMRDAGHEVAERTIQAYLRKLAEDGHLEAKGGRMDRRYRAIHAPASGESTEAEARSYYGEGL